MTRYNLKRAGNGMSFSHTPMSLEQLTSRKVNPYKEPERSPMKNIGLGAINLHEYIDFLETRFLELAEESGVSYKKVEPGQGKVIIKENDVVQGELGDFNDFNDFNDFEMEGVMMNKYVLTIKDDATLERLYDLNIVSYVPKLTDAIVFVRTTMTPEQLMALEGVLHCREASVGTLNV